MPPLNGEPALDDQLDEIVNVYLEAEEAGLSPDRSAIVAEHPELAGGLKRFFAAHDAIERLSQPLRDVAVAARVSSQTDPAAGDSRAMMPKDFGDYVLLEVLGVGGMGVVYRALHSALKREVALKQIIAGPLASAADIERFRNEAEAAASLHHPNIVPILDVGEYLGQRYLTMRLIDGGNLAACPDRFRDHPRAAARLIAVIAGAVHHAHQRGILHRDLKPSNILLDGSGQPHVTDFGLARRMGVESTLTGNGAILGSPAYMAPEQADGRVDEITTATDVYGLGAVLYTLLVGRPPFRGASALETLNQVRSNVPEPPRRLNSRVARDLETICLKCLEREPGRRYSSAAAFGVDLERWLDGKPVHARRTGALRRTALWIRRRPWITALLAITFAAATLGAGGVLWQWRATVAAREALEVALYESRIALADRELSASEPGHAMELLDECPVSLRGWEWFHLRHSRRFDEAKPDGDQSVVLSVAYHPSGKLLATGHGLKTITIWQPDDSGIKVLRAFEAHELGVTSLAFSPDGRRMVSASFDGTAKVWDCENWQMISALEGNALGGLWHAAFDPNGRRIALAGFKKSVGIWDPVRNTLRVADCHDDRVTGVAFGAGGRLLASSSDDATVKLLDVESAQVLRIHREPGLFAYTCVAFSPDGRSLAAGNNGGDLTLWETASGREVFRRARQSTLIRGIAFSPNGSRIATAGGSDHVVTIWDTSTGRDLLSLHGHKGDVWDVAFRPDGEQLASVGVKMVRLWDATRGDGNQDRRFRVLRGHDDRVNAVVFGADSQRIATASWDRTVRIWNTATGLPIQTLIGPAGALSCVAWNRDGRLAASGRGGAITFWDPTGTVVQTLPGHERNITCLAFSHDGRQLASTGEDGVIKLWDATPNVPVARKQIKRSGFNYSLAFRPDDRQLAVANGFGVVVLYDLAVGRQERELRLAGGQRVTGLAYSPDGRALAFGTQSEGVQVWDPSSGVRTRQLPFHDGEVLAVAYSPDGRFLASAGTDRTVRLSDSASGSQIKVIANGAGEIRGVAFSPDGRYLTATNGDRTVRVWDLLRNPLTDDDGGKR